MGEVCVILFFENHFQKDFFEKKNTLINFNQILRLLLEKTNESHLALKHG